MKYFCSLIVICLLSAGIPAFAQNSILWEISGNGLTASSYLMGTLKFTGEEEFYIPREARNSIAKSTMFVIEDPIDHRAQHELNKAVHLPEGQTLKNILTPADYDSVVAFFNREFRIDRKKFETQYAKMIPLALSITMTRLSLGEQVMFYDIELLKLARENKIETYSLEPVEREAEALQKFPMDGQVKALMHSIANFEKQKTEFNKLIQIYPAGNAEEIFEYTLHPSDNNPEFVQAFYTDRNQEWMPKIEKMVHEKASFIAIGVSHLEGDQGILSLLRSKGYTLKPLPVTR
jgi:uncharacterized protein YbaP (TraB family)